MTTISDIEDITLAIPLLADLRAALDPATLATRLSAAVVGGYRVLGATQGGEIMGVLGYRIIHDICWGRTLYVDELTIMPHARGTGIGGALLEAAKARAMDEKCDLMRLCSGLTRLDAHRFYEAHDLKGFSKQFVLALKGD